MSLTLVGSLNLTVAIIGYDQLTRSWKQVKIDHAILYW